MKIGSRTPWGKADHVKIVAPGIWEVSTPGHGGFKLDRVHNVKVHVALREPGGWYEEDCRWAIVAFTFPELFKPAEVDGAKQTLRDYYPDDYRLASGEEVTAANSRKLRETAFYVDHADRYVVMSAWGDWHDKVPKGMVGVVAIPALRALDRVQGRPFGTVTEKWCLLPEPDYRKPEGAFGFLIDETKHQVWENHA